MLAQRLTPIIRARVFLFLRGRPQRRLAGQDEHDLLQLAWCKLIEDGGRRLLSFDPARGVSLEGFVSVVVQRQLIDLTRHRSDQEALTPLEVVGEMPTGADSPETRAIHAQELRALRAHLDAVLPEKGRLILRLLYDDMRSEEEVTAMLNVSAQVVANWKHRIKETARSHRRTTEADEEKKISGAGRTSAVTPHESDG